MTGAELRERRQALGLSLTALAERIGVDRQTIWRWEQGKMTIRHPAMVQIALDRIEQEGRNL